MKNRILMRVLRIAVFLLFVPYTVTFGDEEASLTVYNHTLHFIHVIMNNDSFLYVGPGRSASFTTEGPVTVYVQAFYAPGQGIEGSAQSSYIIGGTTVVSDCNSGTSTCSTDPTAASASWTITADTLAANPPMVANGR
jgi:hypothetical protein